LGFPEVQGRGPALVCPDPASLVGRGERRASDGERGVLESWRRRFDLSRGTVATSLLLTDFLPNDLLPQKPLSRGRDRHLYCMAKVSGRDAAAPNTFTTRASVVSVPARMSIGSVHSHMGSTRIIAARRSLALAHRVSLASQRLGGGCDRDYNGESRPTGHAALQQ
jgi:hypothetical protein